MRKGLLFISISCVVGMMLLSSCNRTTVQTDTAQLPLPAGTSSGKSFSFSTGGAIRFAYGPSLSTDQVRQLEQFASTYIQAITDMFWVPRADITVLFETVSRYGGHTASLLWEQRDKSGVLRMAIVRIELNGFGAENNDPFTQSWISGVFIQKMIYALQTELPHAGIRWFYESTADAMGLILLERGGNAYPSGLSSLLVDKEWSIPLYLKSHGEKDNQSELYRGWLLLAAYDYSVMRKINERLYKMAGVVDEQQLRQTILSELGSKTILDNLKIGDWLDQVGFRSGLETVPDGNYLFWAVTEETGWNPNWLQVNVVAKQGTIISEVEEADYHYRITDAFTGRVVVEGTTSNKPRIYIDFQPGVSDLSVWYLDLGVTCKESSITRKVVIPHLLGGWDARKVVVLVDSTNKVLKLDGILEVHVGNMIVTSTINNGVAYFGATPDLEPNRVTVVVKLSDGRTASFTNLLSLPHIGRQWVLTIP